MNRIKIIKRTDLQSSSERQKTEEKKASSSVIKRQAVQVVANWIDEWRKQKPKDARQSFADLFGAPPSAIG